MSYRFRIGDGGILVLQVLGAEDNRWNGYAKSWRDAKVEDIQISNPFGRDFIAVQPGSPEAIDWGRQ